MEQKIIIKTHSGKLLGKGKLLLKIYREEVYIYADFICSINVYSITHTHTHMMMMMMMKKMKH